ncbi:hypothetical protein XELAEV_18025172mg [Xenopus laevis]|uniref:Uncharacterized protein n=1 Tax=Xenopus laevis TaxID=8355 RepID=A0A974D184_XENLA|nr:hypothetical protein XELAEV_18025172mg [Xenopus laevis]
MPPDRSPEQPNAEVPNRQSPEAVEKPEVTKGADTEVLNRRNDPMSQKQLELNVLTLWLVKAVSVLCSNWCQISWGSSRWSCGGTVIGSVFEYHPLIGLTVPCGQFPLDLRRQPGTNRRNTRGPPRPACATRVWRRPGASAQQRAPSAARRPLWELLLRSGADQQRALVCRAGQVVAPRRGARLVLEITVLLGEVGFAAFIVHSSPYCSTCTYS